MPLAFQWQMVEQQNDGGQMGLGSTTSVASASDQEVLDASTDCVPLALTSSARGNKKALRPVLACDFTGPQFVPVDFPSLDVTHKTASEGGVLHPWVTTCHPLASHGAIN